MATNEQWRQRRRVVQALGAAGALGAVGGAKLAWAQAGKIKVGLMLPYTGTYAALGRAIENGFKLYVRSRAASSAGARSSTSRSTTNRNPRRRPTTSTS